MPVRSRLVALFLIALFALMPASTGAVAARPPEPPRPTTAPRDNHPQALLVAMLDGLLQARFPDTYAGLSVASDGTVQIHVAAGMPAIAQQIEAITHHARRGASAKPSLPGVEVVANARNSLRALNALQDQLTARHHDLAEQGVLLGEWSVDVRSNKVHVGVIGLTAEARDILLTTFGEDKLEVVESTPLGTMSRYQDSPPWQSGNLIASGSIACTTGFNFYTNGDYYLSTAGHCGAGAWYNGGRYIGSSRLVSFSNYGYADAQLITPAGLVAGDVYVRANETAPVVSYTANSQQAVGSSICVDGAYTGEVCGVRIISTNSCYYLLDDGIVMCGLTTAQSPSRAIQHGDSGGPVYAHVNGGLSAYGMLVGGDSTGTRLIYTPVQNVMATFRAALVVR